MTGSLHYAQATREFRDAADTARRGAGRGSEETHYAGGVTRGDDDAMDAGLPAPASDVARWHEAGELRRQQGGRWVIIWSDQKQEFQARPTFTLRSIVASALTIDGLAAEIGRIEQRYAARRRQDARCP